jgi:hypothetical protein
MGFSVTISFWLPIFAPRKLDARYTIQINVKDARLKSRRPLRLQNQMQRRPAKAGRYNVKT